MKVPIFFRVALCLLSCLGLSVGPAAAQMRDRENAAPRVPAAVVAVPESVATPSESRPATECRCLPHDLTAPLLRREWKKALPGLQRLNLVSSAQ